MVAGHCSVLPDYTLAEKASVVDDGPRGTIDFELMDVENAVEVGDWHGTLVCTECCVSVPPDRGNMDTDLIPDKWTVVTCGLPTDIVSEVVELCG